MLDGVVEVPQRWIAQFPPGEHFVRPGLLMERADDASNNQGQDSTADQKGFGERNLLPGRSIDRRPVTQQGVALPVVAF